MQKSKLELKKNLRYCDLLDIYVNLLTDRQKEIMSGYYFDDLSLSEIGENLGINRQSVKTILKRAENLLTQYEDKLRLYFRFSQISALTENIRLKDDSAICEYVDKIRKIITGSDETE